MPNTVRVTYYGMEGEGKTLTEAKADAGRQVEKALAGDYQPVLLSFGGWTALLFRSPRAGWEYKLIAGPDRPLCEGKVYGTSSGFRDYPEIERSVRSHLAQLGYTDATREQAMAFVGPAERAALGRYMAWQRAVKDAKARGLSDEAAREEANKVA